MHQKSAEALATLLGVPDAGTTDYKALFITEAVRATYPNSVATAISSFIDDVRKFTPGKSGGQTLGNCKALIKYVAADTQAGDNHWARVRTLVRFNAVFGKTFCNLTGNIFKKNIPGYNSGMIKTLTTEIYDASHHEAPSFIKYCKDVDLAFADVWNMRKAMDAAGATVANVYIVIHFFHGHNYDFKHLRRELVVDLDHLIRLAPPATKFKGFPAWGPGDAPDNMPATNLKNHFLKHVLDSDPQKHALPYPDEVGKWWKYLSISLTKAQARDNMPSTDFTKIEDLFGDSAPDTTALPHDKVETFVSKLKGSGDSIGVQICNYLYIQHGTKYRDAAISIGANMSNGMVGAPKSDARKLYVAGNKNAIFLIGRMEGDKLGISSCYFADSITSKLGGFDVIWPLA